MKAPRPKFMLTIEPLPHVDAIKSLRFVLKRLIRQYGFRCTDIREIPPKAISAPADSGKTEKMK
jgi:hypothetical protein